MPENIVHMAIGDDLHISVDKLNCCVYEVFLKGEGEFLMIIDDSEHGWITWYLYKKAFKPEESGDAETGPIVTNEFAGLDLISYGMGTPCHEVEIDQFIKRTLKGDNEA